MPDKKLKPCPFCGKSDKVFFRTACIDSFGRELVPAVGCSRCGYQINGEIYAFPEDEKEYFKFSDNLLRNWWNRRNGTK